jgi:hypothetical protein
MLLLANLAFKLKIYMLQQHDLAICRVYQMLEGTGESIARDFREEPICLLALVRLISQKNQRY